MQATTNYSLPTYEETDNPDLITGYNAAITAIDTQMKSNADDAADAISDAATAVSTANTAKATADKAQNTATAAQSAANTASTTATAAKNTADTANANATAAKTAVNAITYQKLTVGVLAKGPNVAYKASN